MRHRANVRWWRSLPRNARSRSTRRPSPNAPPPWKPPRRERPRPYSWRKRRPRLRPPRRRRPRRKQLLQRPPLLGRPPRGQQPREPRLFGPPREQQPYGPQPRGPLQRGALFPTRRARATGASCPVSRPGTTTGPRRCGCPAAPGSRSAAPEPASTTVVRDWGPAGYLSNRVVDMTPGDFTRVTGRRLSAGLAPVRVYIY